MEEQEIQIEEENNKGFWKKLIEAVKTKAFLVNFIISILVVVIIFMGTFYSLDVMTHHGEGLSVPDFTGMSIEQVKKVAKDRNLKFKVIDSVWDAPGKKGSVIAQMPSPDFKVKEGRTILLTTKTYAPPKVKMPDYNDLELIQAKANMERDGFRLGKIIYEHHNSINNRVKANGQLYKGKYIKPGTTIEKGATIDLVVWVTSLKSIPDFKGFDRETVIQECVDKGINPQFVYDDGITDPGAKVWKQSPEAGAQLIPGMNITLWMTLDMNKLDINE